MMNKKQFSRLIAFVAVVMMAPLTVVAQDDGPGFIQVRTMVVKMDKIPDFMRLQAEFAAAAKAAGMSRDFWAEAQGDGNTFHSVTPLDKLADMDDGFQAPMSDEAWGEWIAGFSATIASTTLQILQIEPEWSVPAAEGVENPIMLLRATTVAPGSGGAHRAWVENDMLPAIREGGVKDYSVSRIRMGGNPNTWMSATRYPSWAAIGNPGVLSHMNADARNAMFGNNEATVVDSDVKILRLNADLSY